jgi:hypothetical protein
MYLLRLGSYKSIHLGVHRRPNRDLIDAVRAFIGDVSLVLNLLSVE